MTNTAAASYTTTPPSPNLDYGSCIFSFTGSNEDIPVYSTGYTVLTQHDSTERTTVPCGEFLSIIRHNKGLESEANAFAASQSSVHTKTTALTPSSGGSASTVEIPSIAGTPLSVSSTTSLSRAQCGATQTTASLSSTPGCFLNGNKPPSYKGPPRPTFTDTNLSGCYAGTGGSTSYTIAASDPAFTPRNRSAIALGTQGQAVSMACSDFMTMSTAPLSLASSFQRSPICTAYRDWDLAHPEARCGDGIDPPGVYNYAGFGSWDCCGQCALHVDSMSVMYFPTKTYDGCPTTNTPAPSNAMLMPGGNMSSRAVVGMKGTLADEGTKFAVVDGSTL